MGRVARYKKTKSFDRSRTTSTSTSSEYIWGDHNHNPPTTKKRSKTAERLRASKIQRRNRRRGGGGGGGGGGGTDEEGGFYDVPPCEMDDFDLSTAKNGYDVKRHKALDVTAALRGDSSSSTSFPVTQHPSKQSSTTTTNTTNPPSNIPQAIVTQSQIQLGSQTLSVTIPLTDAEEHRTNRHLNLSTSYSSRSSSTKHTLTVASSQNSSVSQVTKLEGRREGESITKFNKRLREETKMALWQDRYKEKKGGEEDGEGGGGTKRQRRKEYLTARKKRRKRGGTTTTTEDDHEDDDHDWNKTQHNSQTNSSQEHHPNHPISFLDQVERPPTFSRLPRGAKPHRTTTTMMMHPEKSASGATKRGTKHGMDGDKVKKEQEVMEAMRKKVVAQYALLRERRRLERV